MVSYKYGFQSTDVVLTRVTLLLTLLISAHEPASRGTYKVGSSGRGANHRNSAGGLQ